MKTNLYKICVEKLRDKRITIETRLQAVQHSLSSESKSTAGDKHETGRAMLQLEREKLGEQLKQLEISEKTLQRINPEKQNDKVALGTCVETDTMNYYIAISLGKIEVNGNVFFAISAEAPIAKLLLGRKEKDTFTFRGNNITIRNIS